MLEKQKTKAKNKSGGGKRTANIVFARVALFVPTMSTLVWPYTKLSYTRAT